MKVLVSRTDGMGDLVLSLPVAQTLKSHMPDCEVVYLVSEYVAPLLAFSPFVDGHISWDDLENMSIAGAVQHLKDGHFDVILHLFPNKLIATLSKRAHIKERIGNSRTWFHLLTCNKFVHFSKRKSHIHQAQLNLKLLEPLGISLPTYFHPQLSLPGQETPPWLTPFLSKRRFNLIIHPGSHGHGREWSQESYEALLKHLDPERFKVFLTGSSEEAQRFSRLRLLGGCDLMGTLSLPSLLELIGHADGLLASSTGPLHVAAAFGLHALGLFNCHVLRGSSKLSRWRPLGVKAEYLQATKLCTRACHRMRACSCMETMTVPSVLDRLNGYAHLKEVATPS